MAATTEWSSAVLFAIVFYTLCSSVMLVANKVAMYFNPLPGIIICLQVVCTVGYILVLRALNLSEVDNSEWSKVKVFIPYTVSFVLVLYSNGRAIEFSNIETVIVFRAGTPCLVSVLDYLFLGRELPTAKNVLALVGMLLSVIGYAETDSEFAVRGISAYGWVTLYVLSVTFETTYGKKLCQGVKFNAPVWGQVMYTNSMGLLPLMGVSAVAGELGHVTRQGVDASSKACIALALSCFVGVGIAWAVWNCRNQVSATLFTILGVVCKLISVLINVFIWDKHASWMGIGFLCLCLFCSSVYRQAPLRHDVVAKQNAQEASDYGQVPQKSADEEMAEIMGKEVDDDADDEKEDGPTKL